MHISSLSDANNLAGVASFLLALLVAIISVLYFFLKKSRRSSKSEEWSELKVEEITHVKLWVFEYTRTRKTQGKSRKKIK